MDRIIAARSAGTEPGPRPARRPLRLPDRGGRLDRHDLRASHRGGHEPGAGAALVLDRLRRLGPGRRGPAPRRASAPAQLRHVPARPGRVRPQPPAIAAGRRRAQDDVAECRQGRARSIAACSGPGCSPTSRSSTRPPSSIVPPTSSRSSTARESGIVMVNGQLVLDRRAAHSCPPRPRLAAWPMKPASSAAAARGTRERLTARRSPIILGADSLRVPTHLSNRRSRRDPRGLVRQVVKKNRPTIRFRTRTSPLLVRNPIDWPVGSRPSAPLDRAEEHLS